MGSVMQTEKLTHNELIKYISAHPDNRVAWLEFTHRYDPCIRAKVAYWCRHYDASSHLHKLCLEQDDLVQEVYYEKFVQNDFAILREFKGENENAIFAYISSVAQSIIINHIESAQAQKRGAPTLSLFAEQQGTNGKTAMRLIDFLAETSGDPVQEYLTAESIQEILRRAHRCIKGENKDRDIFLFYLSVFEGMTAAEIARIYPGDLSKKRIGNIVAEIKAKLVADLKRHNVPTA